MRRGLEGALASLALAGLGLAGLGLSGCTVGPNYHRPKVPLPPAYRGAVSGSGVPTESPTAKSTPAVSTASSAESRPTSLGNEAWWTVFRDPVLQQLIRTALKQNYDVRIAAQRIIEAQAQVGITRSNQFPIFSGGASMSSQGHPKISSTLPSYSTHAGTLDLAVIWDLDFWGKYRRETEAARDNLLATEWGRRAVINSVVSEVAAGYFQLRELDLALDIARKTLASRQKELQLTRVLFDNGSASQLDMSQAQELVYAASETIPDLERQIRQQENLLSILLGENPQPIARGLKLTEHPLPASVPAGLPAELLERRPDIRQAEANLMAANAEIGVAKAAFFPDFSLTAMGGTESNALNRFFTSPAAVWDATGSATQTIFQGGALRAGLKLTRAQKQEMVLAYRQSIQQALRQVSDALIAYQKNREFTRQQAQLTAAARNAERLSMILHQHGGASFLQVLTSETNSFAAELNLAQAQLNERLALVQLYNALGGGWQ